MKTRSNTHTTNSHCSIQAAIPSWLKQGRQITASIIESWEFWRRPDWGALPAFFAILSLLIARPAQSMTPGQSQKSELKYTVQKYTIWNICFYNCKTYYLYNLQLKICMKEKTCIYLLKRIPEFNQNYIQAEFLFFFILNTLLCFSQRSGSNFDRFSYFFKQIPLSSSIQSLSAGV